jgi:hypothetical protein
MIKPREIFLRSRKRVDMKAPVVWPRPLGLVGRGVGVGRSQGRKCEMKTAPYLLNYRTHCTQRVISLRRLSVLLSILSSRQ